MPYHITLNQLDGVELIIKALRERSQQRGCIASAELADGIEYHALYQDPVTGKCQKLGTMAEPQQPVPRRGMTVVR